MSIQFAQQANSYANTAMLQQAQMWQQRQAQMNLFQPQSYSRPSFQNQGYDRMYSPNQSMGFSSPMMGMMLMMRQMMQSMMQMMGMGGQHHHMGNHGQQQPYNQGYNNGMPSYNQGYNQYPQPQNFWGSSNGSGYQRRAGEFADSKITAGHYGSNVQQTRFGHGIQTIDSGYGSFNKQTHTHGSSQQRITTGSQTTNIQQAYGKAQQTIDAGNGAVNKQSAIGWNTSQAARSGHNSVTNQQAAGGGESQQVARSKDNSTILQTNAKTQFGRVDANGVVAQEGRPGGDSNQTAVLGEGSVAIQRGGAEQTVTSKGDGTKSSMSTGENGGSMTVNNESGSHSGTFDTSGPGKKEINYNSHDGSTTLNYDVGSGKNATRNIDMKAGNDTADIELKDPKNHGDINVQMGAGDDKAVLRDLPQNPDAKINFDGGPSEGNNTFEYRPKTDGNYTIMNGDQIVHQVGEGGAVINTQNFDNFNIFGADGKPVDLGN